jgi:hypothetical protein
MQEGLQAGTDGKICGVWLGYHKEWTFYFSSYESRGADRRRRVRAQGGSKARQGKVLRGKAIYLDAGFCYRCCCCLCIMCVSG